MIGCQFTVSQGGGNTGCPRWNPDKFLKSKQCANFIILSIVCYHLIFYFRTC